MNRDGILNEQSYTRLVAYFTLSEKPEEILKLLDGKPQLQWPRDLMFYNLLIWANLPEMSPSDVIDYLAKKGIEPDARTLTATMVRLLGTSKQLREDTKLVR